MNNVNVHSAKQAALHREQAADSLSVAERTSELSLGVARLMPETLVSARQELDLPIDPDEYKRRFAEQQESAQRAIKEFVDRLRKAGDPRTMGDAPGHVREDYDPGHAVNQSRGDLVHYGVQPIAVWIFCESETSFTASDWLIVFPSCAFTSCTIEESVEHVSGMSLVE